MLCVYGRVRHYRRAHSARNISHVVCWGRGSDLLGAKSHAVSEEPEAAAAEVMERSWTKEAYRRTAATDRCRRI